MELPNYRMPGAKNVGSFCGKRRRISLQRAFTVIFIATIIIWFLQSFDMSLNMVSDSQDSMLAAIAGVIAPVFHPLALETGGFPQLWLPDLWQKKALFPH